MTAPTGFVEVEADGDGADTPEQAAFRDEVRGFLAAHARPREPASVWAVGFHSDAAAQSRSFTVECGWQRTMLRLDPRVRRVDDRHARTDAHAVGHRGAEA